LLSVYTNQVFILLCERERDASVLFQVLQLNLTEQQLLFFFFV
jgi:hypothetical protein